VILKPNCIRKRKNRKKGKNMNRIKEIGLFVILASGIGVLLFLLTRAGFSINGNWNFVALNVIFFTLFFVFFNFRRRIKTRSTSVYVAFLVALFAEMYGFSLTAFMLTWLIPGSQVYSLAFLGTYVFGEVFIYFFMFVLFPLSLAVMAAGMLLVIYGWRNIFKAKGKYLVTNGIYSHTRNPQYLGFIILTLGMAIMWTTVFTLILWPFFVILYYKLAKTEEKEVEAQFGEEYIEYKRKVPMFLPRL
jgi:protein-S-isoprenylcysteine O-methyltransferase Ste14